MVFMLNSTEHEVKLHICNSDMSLVMRKQVFGVSDQVRHKLDWAVTEYGKRQKISDLESRGIVLSVYRKQRR